MLGFDVRVRLLHVHALRCHHCQAQLDELTHHIDLVCPTLSGIQDAIALLRLEDLYVDSFEIRDGAFPRLLQRSMFVNFVF
jgi:hypothetical protein